MNAVKKDQCLCGVHVHTATSIFAWISIVLGVISLILTFTVRTSNVLDEYQWHKAAGAILNIVLLGLLLYGYRDKSHNLYLPYLVISAIQLVISGVAVWTLVLLSPFASNMPIGEGKTMGFTLFFVALFLAAIWGCGVYFGFVIPLRSYNCLKRERRQVSPANFMMPTSRPPNYQYPGHSTFYPRSGQTVVMYQTGGHSQPNPFTGQQSGHPVTPYPHNGQQQTAFPIPQYQASAPPIPEHQASAPPVPQYGQNPANEKSEYPQL